MARSAILASLQPARRSGGRRTDSGHCRRRGHNRRHRRTRTNTRDDD